MIKTVWCVTLKVSDLKKAIAFYGETLGLDKKYEYSSYAGFQCGGVEIGLSPGRRESRPVEDAPSVEFVVEDVDAAYEALKRKGVSFVKEPHDEAWGGRQASFLDLDGNLLEIVQFDWAKYFEVSLKGARKP